ncbi:MAG TPA: ATPase domain-containing protein [Polyangiaceae bacterium]|nr:ATPase domain-containing protein [Polyangiaceae bacterium]
MEASAVRRVSPAGPRDRTGITGLDDVLAGGLPSHRLYLVKGEPGVGKTTLALQFLLEGVRAGQRVLYITLSETETEIKQVAESHGWSLEGMDLYELSSAEQTLSLDDENTLYSTADVDLKETMRVLLDEVERVKPQRVVFDSLSEIRLLANTPIRYRRQLLALKQHFAGRACTVLLLDDRTGDATDLQVESLAHGVILLEQRAVDYGADRRRLRIGKLRGSPFRSGYHDFTVLTGGLAVFPRLIAAEHRTDLLSEPMPSGIGELDALLGGGVDRSTATLLVGPAGTGKSAIATQFARAAAVRGESTNVFLFEERLGTLLRRAQQLGMPLDPMIEQGRVRLQQIDPAELAPDQFTQLVRDAVEKHGARLVIIDSINGYYNAMPEARYLTLQMHELLAFLSERGVATILTMAQSGMMGSQMSSPVDLSYLADTIIMLRYFEAYGHIRKAVSVLKKRSGGHERAIRELELGASGVHIGPPLQNMRGVLTGNPQLLDESGGSASREPG